MSKCPLCLNTESVYNALLADLRELRSRLRHCAHEYGQQELEQEAIPKLDELLAKHTGKK